MEYLSDGITESIINSLAQISKLRVIAQSTSLRYKGREVDPQKVGRDLDVRAVLTGKVLHHGGRLVISAELVDAADGSHLWGAQYNRPFSDIFAVQEEVAKEILEKLRLKLTGEDQKLLAKRPTSSIEAYQLYLKGRYSWSKFSEEGIQRGLKYFKQAVDEDPNYALAHVGLADSHTFLSVCGSFQPKDVIPKAKAAAINALQIDEALAKPTLRWHTSN